MDELVITIEPEQEMIIELEPLNPFNSGEMWGEKLPDLLTLYNLAKI